MECMIELIKWLLEDVMAPILIALFTVWLTEKYGKEKEKRDRKAQLQYQYLEKLLDEMNSLDKKLYEYANLTDTCLGKHDPEERLEMANEVQRLASGINVYLIAMETSLKPACLALGIGIDVESIHEEVGHYVDEVHDLFEQYLWKTSTVEANEKINVLTEEVHKKMERYNRCVADEINKLLA